MRTARSRISGEYLLDLFITQSSQEMEPPTNPGRFNSQTLLYPEYILTGFTSSMN